MSWKRESRRGLAGGGGKAWTSGEALSVPHYNAGQAGPQIRHGKIIGGTWRKTVRASVHQLRRPSAWCVDVADLEAAEALGVEWLEIHDVETGVVWSAPLSTFRTHGFELDRGFGRQVALPLSHWSRRKVGEAEAQQLELWAEVAHGER